MQTIEDDRGHEEQHHLQTRHQPQPCPQTPHEATGAHQRQPRDHPGRECQGEGVLTEPHQEERQQPGEEPDAHEDGEFSSAVGFDDLVGGGAELELVGGFTDLLERAVDEFQGAAGGGVAVGFAKLLDYVTPRVADAVIADTAELHRFLLGVGVAPHRVTTINSGVRPEMFATGDARKIRGRFAVANEPLIIYTGTFDQLQGLEYLLAAFRIVHQHDSLAKLLLIGSTINPTHRSKYARMAERLGIASRVTITSCALGELPDLLAAADIAVVPRPESAGIPTKLLNYMAAGKAIVSFEKSATILENGKTGRLVAPATAERLAEGILGLLADRNLALELGRNARSLVFERFDWRSIVEQMEEVYDKLLIEQVANSHRLRRRPRGAKAF